jgi:hypothetical protein
MTNNNVIIMPEMANAVICPDTGKSLKHNELITKLRDRIKWMRSTANEINRLYNTNTIRFIQRSNIPKGRKVTYGSFVVDIKDQKEEKERTRLTVGGDQIEYPGDKSTRTAGLTTAKILINSVISTLGAKFLLKHPPRTIRIHGNQFIFTPSGNSRQIRLTQPSTGRRGVHRNPDIYVRVAAGRHPRQRIVTAQSSQGWIPTHTTHTHVLRTHDTRPISFSIVVDDFGVKYVGREHAEHLMACMKKIYNISIDWNGTVYYGLTLEWDCKKRTVDLSLPGYIKAALHKYQHIYGAKTQFVTETTTSPALSDKEINKLQQPTGTLLYCARAVDPTLITPIDVLETENQQPQTSQQTKS